MKKFAIYKAETGYYYYEYIESLDQLEGTLFRKIIPEHKLPVVLDGKGGYFQFDDKDLGFVEIMESDKEVPLPVEKLYFKNDDNFKLGWMNPEGDTYSCDYTSHTKAAGLLAKKFCPDSKFPERALGKAGWLKIIDSWDGTQRQHGQFVYSLSGKITKKQADKLFDLGLYDNEEVQRLLADCQDYW
ncbi:MAG: hypothetical protein IJ737_03900 [Ruminococcus sp.]|nr:hypothetical protein [Ruminococcus sp.]